MTTAGRESFTASVETRPTGSDTNRPVPWWVLPAVMAVLFGGHLLLSRSMTGPFLSDGTGYLANARWLAGRAGDTFQGSTAFYHAGYSVLLAPLFRLFDDIDTVYQGILVVNAALATSSVLVYRALATRLGLAPRPALLAGLVTAVYPAVLLQPSAEWSENAYHLGFGLLLLAVHRLVRRHDGRAAVVVGIAAAGLYAVHPRGLAVVGSTALTLVVLGWRRSVPRPTAVIGVSVLVVTFLAVRVGHAVLIDAMWADNRPLHESDVIGRITEPELLWNMVERSFGQGWYLLVATAGLALIGVVALVADARRPSTEIAVFARVTLSAMAATVAASVVMMSDGTRVDHLVYGRYIEGFLPALLVFGVVGLARWGRHRELLLLAGASLVGVTALAGATVGTVGGDRFTGEVAPFNVLGILAWNASTGAVDLFWVSVGGLVAAGVVLLARLRSLSVALSVVVVVFIGSALAAHDRVLEPFTTFWTARHQLADVARNLTDGPVAYERAAYTPSPGNFYQLELFDRIHFWDGRDAPGAELVISTRDGASVRALGGRAVYLEARADQALWVLPGPLQDQLTAEGRVFPAGPSDPLPDSARRAQVTPRSATIEADERSMVDVEVTHVGTGSPWPALAGLGDSTGAIRLQAIGPDGSGGIGDLTTVLAPGQSTTVALLLRPLPPGHYQLRVVVLQEGVGPLEGEGVLTLDVR